METREQATFRLFPEEASAYAQHVDQLYFFLLTVAAFFLLLIGIAILYFVIRYYRRPNVDRAGTSVGQANASVLWLEMTWTFVPLGLTMVMFYWGAWLFFEAHTPPADAMEVTVVGKQWMWKLQHSSGKSEINQLHLPVGRPVKLKMISEDVIHSFYAPEFRVKQDVLPGRYTYLWLEPNRTGEFHLFCAEYCGTSHSKMVGKVIVQSPAEYADWLQGTTEESPVATGQKLFEQYRCDTCHAAGRNSRCPPLVGVYGRQVALQDGTRVKADDAYLRESILNPTAKIVAGFQPLMPTYKGQVDEQEILSLIAYLKSLSPADEGASVHEGKTP